jgi:hypothetical protein
MEGKVKEIHEYVLNLHSEVDILEKRLAKNVSYKVF